MPATQTLSEYRLAIDDLDRAILTLAGRINAATYELLVLVREFDERAGWLEWGFNNCTQWLHWRCDLGMSAAREKTGCSTKVATRSGLTPKGTCISAAPTGVSFRRSVTGPKT